MVSRCKCNEDDCGVDIDHILLSKMLEEASEKGAKLALERIGLHDEKAGQDLREVRGILESYRELKSEIGKTVVKILTTGVLFALGAGLIIKLKIFGGQ